MRFWEIRSLKMDGHSWFEDVLYLWEKSGRGTCPCVKESGSGNRNESENNCESLTIVKQSSDQENTSKKCSLILYTNKQLS